MRCGCGWLVGVLESLFNGDGPVEGLQKGEWSLLAKRYSTAHRPAVWGRGAQW